MPRIVTTASTDTGGGLIYWFNGGGTTCVSATNAIVHEWAYSTGGGTTSVIRWPAPSNQIGAFPGWAPTPVERYAPLVPATPPAEPIPAEPPSPEQVIARQVVGRLAERVDPAAAALRAELLLLEYLDPDQRATWTSELASFLVTSQRGRRYRIRRGEVANIERLRRSDGAVIARYCIHPSGVPIADVILSQLLMLLHNEDQLLRIANPHPVTGQSETLYRARRHSRLAGGPGEIDDEFDRDQEEVEPTEPTEPVGAALMEEEAA